MFFIYINDLSNSIKNKRKLFADDTSFFSAVHEINTSEKDLNHDLEEISEWAFQWKMKFNQDPTKQAQDNIQQEKGCFYSPTCLF